MPNEDKKHYQEGVVVPKTSKVLDSEEKGLVVPKTSPVQNQGEKSDKDKK